MVLSYLARRGQGSDADVTAGAQGAICPLAVPRPRNQAVPQLLCAELGVGSLAAKVLAARGFTDAESGSPLSPPFARRSA